MFILLLSTTIFWNARITTIFSTTMCWCTRMRYCLVEKYFRAAECLGLLFFLQQCAHAHKCCLLQKTSGSTN